VTDEASRLAATLSAPTGPSTLVSRRQAVVDAVNGDGTVDVDLGDATTPTVVPGVSCKAWYSPTVGDVVFVEFVGSDMVVDGPLGEGASDVQAGLVRLAEVTLTASATTIDFTGIPSTYRTLRLVAELRSDRAANRIDSFKMQFNGDTTEANYHSQQLIASGTAVSTAEFNTSQAGSCSAATAQADQFGACEFVIPRYATTAHYKSWSTGGMVMTEGSADNPRMDMFGGWWKSSAAINRITLKPGSGTNFVAESYAALYGMR
jgi:hypothetical protein